MPENLKFDHYEVLTRDDGAPHELGRGAMGITYKAFDTNLRIPVALKVINGTYLDSEVARQRFIREARSAARLRHRNVASVFHLGIDGDAYFYAMEFIDGETLDALVKREGPLDPVLALRISAQVARALNAAQSHSLVHRDIKPANLMLIREDDELAVKVIDFGLAKSYLPGETDENAATLSSGGFVGTPLFASPEQLEELEIDVRSDIYSLGITLWYTLAGQTPFSGSTAQVMSQHLSRSPPFEKLSHLPDTATKLLGRMLEKDRALRPQSPLELRREIETCIAAISGTPVDASALLPLPQGPASPADLSSPGQSQVQFEPGTLVDERYSLIAKLGETSTGSTWQARDQKALRNVRLLLLKAELLSSAEAFTHIERDVEKAQSVTHPNLLTTYAFETLRGASFIATEGFQGFSLLELLRARRELPAPEVLRLLEPAAAGLDFALQHGPVPVELTLQQIFIHFPSEVANRDQLLRQPIEQWPPFVLKLSPLLISPDLAVSETWAGGQTLVDQSPLQSSQEPGPKALRELASVAYELLGGASSLNRLRFAPLASLSEQGNEIIRQALGTKPSFPTATEFWQALAAQSDPDSSSSAPIPAAPAKNSAPTLPSAAARFTPPPKPTKKGLSVWTITSLAGVSALGAFAFFAIKQAPTSKLELTPTPNPQPTPVPVAKQDPPPSTPTPPPATPPPATPAPPTRDELRKIAFRDATALENKEDWPACIQAWIKIAKTYPETDVGKVHLEIVIERLRNRPEEVNAREFPALRDLLTEAGQLDVLAAHMFLGESLKKSEPTAAFNWYSSAAARGEPTALRMIGLMVANGVNGAERDPAKAFSYFQAASNKGDIPAKYLAGECYLYGRGVQKDEKLAVEYLREAAEGGNLFAVDLLGTCYHQGLGVPKDSMKAFQLFTQASDRGYAVATGNLGVLHIRGEGLAKPDPKKAVELFLKGIKLGDGNCMYFYALCLEGGTGVSANRLQAQTWFIKAAEAGNPKAIEWCRSNNVSFVPLK